MVAAQDVPSQALLPLVQRNDVSDRLCRGESDGVRLQGHREACRVEEIRLLRGKMTIEIRSFWCVEDTSTVDLHVDLE